MKSWMKITLLILVIFICVGAFYYLTFSRLIESSPPVMKDSYLQLDIFGEIPEKEKSDPLTKIFAGDIPTLEGIQQCIRKAKEDASIKGIIIRPISLSCGWAKLDEMKQTLKSFKESGKPIYAYLEMGTNKEYYLSLESQMIFGPPANILIVNGLVARGYYLKGTLDKIGIEADFLAVGKYKSAPNLLTRDDMPPEDREVTTAILDDYYVRYLEAISTSRNLDMNTVKKLTDYGIYYLKNAYENHLIDTLMFYNEFQDYLKSIDNKKPRFVSYSRYKKAPFPKVKQVIKDQIALIYCVGDIVSGLGEAYSEEGIMIGEGMASTIRKAAEDNQVKALVLRIDSPGGSGSAADIIWQEVKLARAKKPVIVSMSDVAASGGYYIGMGADSIFAQAGSLVGSIGVFSGKLSFKEFYKKIGINKVEIPRGANATLFSEIQKFDNNQRKILQENIEYFYQTFVTKVAEGRHMTYEQVHQLAQGRVWTGAQALDNGLIDRIGGLFDAVNAAKKMAGIPVESYVKLKIYPREKSFLQKILSEGLTVTDIIYNKTVPTPVKKYMHGFLYFKDFEPLMIMPMYLDIQ